MNFFCKKGQDGNVYFIVKEVTDSFLTLILNKEIKV